MHNQFIIISLTLTTIISAKVRNYARCSTEYCGAYGKCSEIGGVASCTCSSFWKGNRCNEFDISLFMMEYSGYMATSRQGGTNCEQLSNQQITAFILTGITIGILSTIVIAFASICIYKKFSYNDKASDFKYRISQVNRPGNDSKKEIKTLNPINFKKYGESITATNTPYGSHSNINTPAKTVPNIDAKNLTVENLHQRSLSDQPLLTLFKPSLNRASESSR